MRFVSVCPLFVLRFEQLKVREAAEVEFDQGATAGDCARTDALLWTKCDVSSRTTASSVPFDIARLRLRLSVSMRCGCVIGLSTPANVGCCVPTTHSATNDVFSGFSSNGQQVEQSCNSL